MSVDGDWVEDVLGVCSSDDGCFTGRSIGNSLDVVAAWQVWVAEGIDAQVDHVSDHTSQAGAGADEANDLTTHATLLAHVLEVVHIHCEIILL